MTISETSVKNALTRTSGYLTDISSHSLQPYRGCSLGNSLCGQACYVQHNPFLTRGKAWGSFLEARSNCAESYLANQQRERVWARKQFGSFSIFLASSTEPFLPQEKRLGVTRRLLEAMLHHPPDLLIVQTHSAGVLWYRDLYPRLKCDLRFHLSVESDRSRLPGLPPSAYTVEQRLAAAQALSQDGHQVVITVSPLLPVKNPVDFFARISRVARAVVLDHFILGDGSRDGSRTRKTPVPKVMELVEPGSTSLDYRDRLAALATLQPGLAVGLGRQGFGARYLSPRERKELQDRWL